MQSLWGSRQEQYAHKIKGLARTGILSLIDKASKHTGKKDLRTVYERLCDVVHPSLGANSAYYAGAGLQGGFSDLAYIELSLETADFDDLRPCLLDAWGWSLQTMSTGLRRLERIADCLCMAAKLYAYEDLLYWGVVRPSGEYEPCPCGSGLKMRYCDHVMPDDMVNVPTRPGRD